jgi:(1->4)-alpha-D-glucan 1-alpha-D-glucosylmutase
LTGDEKLPGDWPVHGTTGYEFGKEVAQLLVDSSAESAITNIYRRFIGHSMHFGHLVYAKKRQVMRLSLANDVNVLGNLVDRLSEQNRWFRDFTLQALARAVRETIACFPVYRTYLAPGQPVREEDQQVVERAIAAAKRRNPGVEASVFNFLRDILLFRFPENLDDAARAAHTQFVLKFQQYTGPIMAKGLEDTAFYIFNRLAALNEVGGEPQHFGISPDTFHQRNLERQRDWPATLLTTSTHDTKRSEDVRARMIAISEIPEAWRSSLKRWRTNNHRWKKQIDEVEAPEANEEYLLYQTLLGSWPLQADGEPEKNASPEYVKRIQAYMAKALNEAKLNTSWVQPNEEWLDAMNEFVAHILETNPKNRFLPNFLPMVGEIARFGIVNSLSQTFLKLTSPGVPDIYQGNEIWDLSLVDPDNRRSVDYTRRRAMMDGLAGADPQELMRNWPDGRIKMFLIQKVLSFRRGQPDIFRHGEYLPIRASGPLADSCIAFVRQLDERWILVIAPRLSSRVGFPPVGQKWQETAIEIPENLKPDGARELFSGKDLPIAGRRLTIAEVMPTLPFALVIGGNPSALR